MLLSIILGIQFPILLPSPYNIPNTTLYTTPYATPYVTLYNTQYAIPYTTP